MTLILAACGSGGNSGGPTTSSSLPGDKSGTSETTTSTTTTTTTTTTSGNLATYAPYGVLSTAEVQLLGPDSNVNGVRDDIDTLIATTYSDPVQQQRVVTYAQWIHWAIIRGNRGTTSVDTELTSFGNAVACLYDTQYAQLGKKAAAANALEGQILNTVARTRAYLKWDASTSGMATAFSSTPCTNLKAVTTP